MSKGKQTKTVRDQTIIEALGEQLKAAATITLEGEVYRPKDLQKQFQEEVDAMKVTQSARTALRQAILAERQVAPQVTLLRKALRAYLIGTYGPQSVVVAKFGFTPKEATAMTVEEKADANKKRAATNAAGGRKALRKQKEAAAAALAASTDAPVSAPAAAPGISAGSGVAPKTVATS